MLSPGKHHLSVPRDPVKNLSYRLDLLKSASESSSLRRDLISACTEDALFFINSFVWQYNPLKIGDEVGPFITWDFQDEALLKIFWCIENQRSIVFEKSREMGGTYLCLLALESLARFHRNMKFLAISRSQDAVSRPGDPDCLFYKLDHIQEHIPSWLGGTVKRLKMSFSYESGSKITGEASTGKAGVGGRATAIFVDEFSQIDEDKEVRQRTASTTNTRIFNGTHKGLDTEFYQVCQQPEIEKQVLHWTQHPEKRKGLYRFNTETGKVEVLDTSYVYPPDFHFVMDGTPTGGPYPGLRSPWYDKKVVDIGSARGAAMDLDIDPRGSQSQAFDPLLIRELKAIFCIDPEWEGDFRFDDENRIVMPIEIVKKPGGPLRLWCTLDHKGHPPRARYVAGSDISRGRGRTNSCLTIANRETGEKVLEYATPFVEPENFAILTVWLCELFRSGEGETTYLCWEQQGPGEHFGDKVLKLGYTHIYYRTAEHTLRKTISDSPGWYPANNTRTTMLEEYQSALRKKHFINRSELALDECLKFRYNLQGYIEHSELECDDPSGAKVNHGDRTIADALCNKMMGPMSDRPPKVKQEEQMPVNSLASRRQRADNEKREAAWA